MTKITKDMIIGDILNMDPEMAGVLVAGGMLVARVNAFVESKQQ